LKNYSSPNAKVFLIGNKTDLEDRRKVALEEAINLKNDYKVDLFFESSAKNGMNVKNV
jgi:GTPase SAR1 family protein